MKNYIALGPATKALPPAEALHPRLGRLLDVQPPVAEEPPPQGGVLHGRPVAVLREVAVPSTCWGPSKDLENELNTIDNGSNLMSFTSKVAKRCQMKDLDGMKPAS